MWYQNIFGISEYLYTWQVEFNLVSVKLIIITLFITVHYRKPYYERSLNSTFCFLSVGLLFTLKKDAKFCWNLPLTCGRSHPPALTPHMKRPIRIISKDWDILLKPMIDAATIMSTLLHKRHFFLWAQEKEKIFKWLQREMALNAMHWLELSW